MDRNEVRDMAMRAVMELETERGSQPKQVHQRGVGYDIQTDSRQIEVKGRTGDDHFVALNEENIKAFDKQESFWLYIVHFDKNDNPTVMELNREEVEKRKKERRQWEIPFWNADLEEIRR